MTPPTRNRGCLWSFALLVYDHHLHMVDLLQQPLRAYEHVRNKVIYDTRKVECFFRGQTMYGEFCSILRRVGLGLCNGFFAREAPRGGVCSPPPVGRIFWRECERNASNPLLAKDYTAPQAGCRYPPAGSFTLAISLALKSWC